MFLFVKEDESSYPGNIGFLGADGIVLQSDLVPYLIQQFNGLIIHDFP